MLAILQGDMKQKQTTLEALDQLAWYMQQQTGNEEGEDWHPMFSDLYPYTNINMFTHISYIY